LSDDLALAEWHYCSLISSTVKIFMKHLLSIALFALIALIGLRRKSRAG
jgi:hypothetical protein